MKTTLLLCDHAQEVAGKLYILGGGWSIYRGAPVTMGLAVKISIPWDAANIPHEFAARLVTEDGHDPVLPTPEGGLNATRVEFQGRFEAGEPDHRIDHDVGIGARGGLDQAARTIAARES